MTDHNDDACFCDGNQRHLSQKYVTRLLGVLHFERGPCSRTRSASILAYVFVKADILTKTPAPQGGGGCDRCRRHLSQNPPVPKVFPTLRLFFREKLKMVAFANVFETDANDIRHETPPCWEQVIL